VASLTNVATAQPTTHVVGPGGNFRSFQELATDPVLLAGDTVRLVNALDRSLQTPFGQTNGVDNGQLNLTFTGGGRVTPSSGWNVSSFYRNSINNTTSNNTVTLASSFYEFANFTSTAINARNVTISGGGTNTFTGNSAPGGTGISANGGAIYAFNNLALVDGTNTFTSNSARDYGGAIFANGTATLGSATTDVTNIFTNNSVTSHGGAIYGSYTTITSGTNEFAKNTAGGSGGAIYASFTNFNGGENTFTENSAGNNNNGGAIYGSYTNLNDGKNTFIGNTAGGTGSGHGGAIGGITTISGGTNEFTDNRAGTTNGSGGAINGNTLIRGGTNTFTGNKAGSTTFNNGQGGGAIGASTINIEGGTNEFTRNSTSSHGGALHGTTTVSLTGGTNDFTDNWAFGNGLGGAIYASGATTTLRAQKGDAHGDFTFSGNRDRVGTDFEKANALHVASTATNATLTLAAEEGRRMTFYDPITSVNNANLNVYINRVSDDKGTVVFDGSLYKDMDALNRYSAVTGLTTVSHGSLVLNNGVTYGADNARGFTLNTAATLVTDDSVNRIQGGLITFYGDVEIAKGGMLELIASDYVDFYGTMTTGLGMKSYGSMVIGSGFDLNDSMRPGDIAFYWGSTLSLYWDDDLDLLYDGWSKEYSFFDVGTNGFLSGLDELFLDMSAFDDLEGFSYIWNSNIGMLTLTYNSEVPEPATLAIIGLGLAGLGWARRRRR